MHGRPVRVDDADGVRVLTLDRPAARNAISLQMQDALCAQLARADQDPSVRAVVLTGADPAFCAGVDVTETERFTDRYANRFRLDPGQALRAMRTPVLCAVNGACVSGGLELALSATFVIASDRARFADTHARLGVLPSWGLSALLPKAVGVRMARELSLTGRFMTADEALRRGLVNHVVPHADLLARALETAAGIASTGASADLLGLYSRSDDLTLSAALTAETDAVYGRPFDAATFHAGARAADATGRT